MSSIFISHSSKDNRAAEQIAGWLRKQNFESLFLDFDPQFGIPAGRDWKQELYRQMRACNAVIILCSEHSTASQWCISEVAIASILGKRLFPVRIDQCSPHHLISDLQIIDFTEDLAQGLERLTHGLEKAGLDPRDHFQWDPKRPPYPGLIAFQEADAGLFHGREESICDGLDSLHNLRRYGGKAMLMLTGASGSGKSSLARAGLLPRLRRDPEAWMVLDPFRPGHDPFMELATVLVAAYQAVGESRDRRQIRDLLASSAGEVSNSCNPLTETIEELRLLSGHRNSTAVFTIDQFEDCLLYTSDAADE